MHLKTLPAFYPLHACKQNHFSHVQLCMTLWTVAHQAPLSMGFSRRVYWSGLPYPSPGFTHYPVPKLLLHIQVVVTAASHFSVPKSVLISLSSKSLQLCPTLCTVARQVPLSMGIFQARILEWICHALLHGIFSTRDWTCISYISCIGRWVLYHQRHLGSPWAWAVMTKDIP